MVNNHYFKKKYYSTNSKESFWFQLVIYLWILIIITSLFFIFLGEDNWATKISTYGGLSYFFFLSIIGFSLKKNQPLASKGILRGIKIVFFFWLFFLIIFSLFFLIGFKIS